MPWPPRWRAPVPGYPRLRVEVEADTLAQVAQAVAAGADIILLDNMTPARLRQAVRLVAGRALTEASGGVNLKTVRAIAATGRGLYIRGGHHPFRPGGGHRTGFFCMTPDAKILAALRANPDGVSGAGLAEQLGISRAAMGPHSGAAPPGL